MASVRLSSVTIVLGVYLGLVGVFGITTIHHDKPEETSLPIMATKMKRAEEETFTHQLKPTLNVTIAASERQKRLLPYMTFYLEQDFNRPQSHMDYNQDYRLVEQKPTTYQQYPTKYSPPESPEINYQNKYVSPVQAPPQKYKLTPFLESNALPGPFLPMRNPGAAVAAAPTKVTYTPVGQYQTVKVPNYSAIYDKLSQLKLQQQHQLAQSYNPQHYARKPQVNYMAPAKTIIQTYTSENIDIPSGGGANYDQLIKTYNEPQIQSYSPHQDHVQPVTEEERKQYYEDQQYNTEIKKETLRPIILLRQKPQEINKPVLLIQRKPIQKYNFRVPEQLKYRPVKFENPATPTYINIIPKYTPQKYEDESENYAYQSPRPPPKQFYYQQQPPKYEPVVNYSPKYVTESPMPVYHHTTTKYDDYITQVPHYSQPEPQETKPVVTEDPNSLSLILKKLQDTNALPQTLTADNIDNSIRTLVRILGSLKKQQKFSRPIVVPDDSGEYEEDIDNEADVDLGGGAYPEDTPEGGTPGKPGVDYPALTTIPQTSFNCKTQRYKGFFGDPDTNCQVWHYCDLNGGQASFLCPNGTIFSQVALTCDWWYNVKCANTPQLYVLNERLYKYILPLSPKFPEDYSGPLVDKYLALKFQEMEEKMKKERKKNKENSSDEGESQEQDVQDDADELSREEQKKMETIAVQSEKSKAEKQRTEESSESKEQKETTKK